MHIQSIYKSIKSAHSQIYKISSCKRKKIFNFYGRWHISWSRQRKGNKFKELKGKLRDCNVNICLIGIRYKDILFQKFTHYNDIHFIFFINIQGVKNTVTFPVQKTKNIVWKHAQDVQITPLIFEGDINDGVTTLGCLPTGPHWGL